MCERINLLYKMILIAISKIKIAVFFIDLRYGKLILYDFAYNINKHLPV